MHQLQTMIYRVSKLDRSQCKSLTVSSVTSDRSFNISYIIVKKCSRSTCFGNTHKVSISAPISEKKMLGSYFFHHLIYIIYSSSTFSFRLITCIMNTQFITSKSKYLSSRVSSFLFRQTLRYAHFIHKVFNHNVEFV